MRFERGIGRHRIGSWHFHPASGELRRRSDVRRLEPRAAKALELLCDADGGVVSHDQLIRSVWNGRSLSENSVAVVIGQLRKALEDDAREPGLIETIPKRGYRLVADASPATQRPALRRLQIAIAVALLVLIGAGMWGRPIERQIAVADVSNETGDRAYDPLARATSELIVTQLSKRGFAVRRGAGDGPLRFSAKLVIWNGAPSLGLTATDRNGVVRWSAMTNGSPADVPAGVATQLDSFERAVARRP